MDRRIIAEKLESLRRCVRRVETRCPESVEELRASLDLQDILSVNLMRAVQICVDVAAHLAAGLDVPAPETMAGAFDALETAGMIGADMAAKMRAAVGFRNVAVHAYSDINWAIVFTIARSHLEDFRDFALAVMVAIELPASDSLS